MVRQSHPRAVPLLLQGLVAVVLAPRQAALAQDRAERLAANAQQWAEHANAGDDGIAGHTAEPRRAAAAEEPLEDGLGLIVGVVREDDAEQPVPFSRSAE